MCVKHETARPTDFFSSKLVFFLALIGAQGMLTSVCLCVCVGQTSLWLRSSNGALREQSDCVIPLEPKILCLVVEQKIFIVATNKFCSRQLKDVNCHFDS